MRARTKLTTYAVALLAITAAGAAVGAAIGPDLGTSGADEPCRVATTAPAGLAATRDGYTLSLATRELPSNEITVLELSITGPDGELVEEYDIVHERELHLVLVGRNLVDYAHLHPERTAAGAWSAELPAQRAGSYRIYADFTPSGADRLTLIGDLTVLGEVAASEVPAPSATASVDGYDVSFDGDLTAGTESELTITIERDGRPVSDVEPYLGALGHLVAVRDGDLAYVHVHPLEEADGPGGPSVTFAIDVPTPGMYRLFFEFDHDGAVHAAAATVVAVEANGCSPTSTIADGGHDGHEG